MDTQIIDYNEQENVSFMPLFANPVMSVKLDLNLETLTNFALHLQKLDKDKEAIQISNRGGWQSDDIKDSSPLPFFEEFNRLKSKINQYLQIYHSSVLGNIKFKETFTQELSNIWININQKHHYNEWHIHSNCSLSGVFYVSHDNTSENGNIMFKNPVGSYIELAHLPKGKIEEHNEITSDIFEATPSSNMLLIFPSWLTHRVGENLKDKTRISFAFNSEY